MRAPRVVGIFALAAGVTATNTVERLQAVVAGRWTAAVAWLPIWGGTYNYTRDRSTAQAYVSYQF